MRLKKLRLRFIEIHQFNTDLSAMLHFRQLVLFFEKIKLDACTCVQSLFNDLIIFKCYFCNDRNLKFITLKRRKKLSLQYIRNMILPL